MQSHIVETLVGVKKEVNDYIDSRFTGHLNNTLQDPLEVSSSSEKNDSNEAEDNDEITNENACRQIVVYDPTANGEGTIVPVPVPVPEPIRSQQMLFGRPISRVLPSVGAFTVQCSNCYKWRLIPTKEKYEELREHIIEQPFYCETAREWRPDVSCNDDEDISQDGSRLWAIDRPNIALPPPGWQRLLRIRGEGSSKFADVYYVAPSGKRFRSMVEIHKYLTDHPEFIRDGVKMSQFSFQVPRPLQDNYVRKRPPRVKAPCDDPLPSGEAKAISWVPADDCTELQLGRPALEAPPSIDAHVSDTVQHRPKKRTKRTPTKQMLIGNQPHDQSELNLEDPGHATINGFNL